MPRPFDAVLATPLPGIGARLGIQVENGALVGSEYLPSDTELRQPDNLLTRQVADELAAYFRDGAYAFRLPLSLHGTAFQRRVWRALQTIPAGSTLTYGELAGRLGTGARAVGNACRHNRIPLIVPCHRVVAANGHGGFMGATDGAPLTTKDWLLEHERRAG